MRWMLALCLMLCVLNASAQPATRLVVQLQQRRTSQVDARWFRDHRGTRARGAGQSAGHLPLGPERRLVGVSANVRRGFERFLPLPGCGVVGH